MPIQQDIYEKIVQAKIYIDDNFQDPVDLDLIARHAFISRFHFHRLFRRRIYNRTPHQYLTTKRIEMAGRLLVENDLSIREICNSVGFESQGTFSLLFKRKMGCPPNFYRTRVRQQQKKLQKEPHSQIPQCFCHFFDFGF